MGPHRPATARCLKRPHEPAVRSVIRPGRASHEMPMEAYQGRTRDRLKASLVVVVLHLLIGYAFITGLNIASVPHSVQSLQLFDIAPPPPAPPPPPPPK